MVSLPSRSCTYIDSSLKLNGAKRAVTVGDKSITLRLTPFRILELLVSNAGRVVSRQSRFSVIWGSDFDPCTKRLEVYVNYLRRNLLVFGGAVKNVTRRGSALLA
ncbi:winged helix-turn-helix domain-containing protein [Pseudomonas putida]|uniref:winged helix-turn-helix domain-containing protein n=1 Tax=Pseudomonas putida TaxID=303 RepID=UPI0039058C39